MKRIIVGDENFEQENNIYLFEGDGSVVLLDTAISSSVTERQLESGLSNHGYALEDVSDILLTHWHADHAGLAGRIQERSGATVYVHELDAPFVRQDDGVFEDLRESQFDLFEEWQIPAEKRESVSRQLEASRGIHGEPVDVTPVRDGERVEVGDHKFEVVHSAGHTAGHCCFVTSLDGSEALFGGDALLPQYTPNIGGSDPRVDDPLETYLESLDRISCTDYDTVFPGHGEIIHDPTERIATTKDHHFERADRIRSIIEQQEPATAWQVSVKLFGPLSGFHVLHGVGEADAHLRFLANNGEITEHDGRYVSAER